MRVLIAFDGSRGALTALDLTRAIPWPDGTELRLARVDGTRALDEDLAEVAANLMRPGLTVDHVVIRGEMPQDAIVAEASRFGADLLITGSRGHGPMTTALIGSSARAIAEHAPCPVLVARSSSFERLLVAEDGSASAFAARRVVATWPIFVGRHVHVLSVAHVATPILAGVAAAVNPDARQERQIAEMEARASYGRLAVETAEQLRIAGRTAESEVRSGDPAQEIVAAAQRWDADLVVLGSRGRNTLERVLLGSVAREVLLRAPCSVLVVRKA